jgi:membrane-bound inhibitor of C-type lysozyme
MRTRFALLTALAAILASPALADVSVGLGLSLSGDAEVKATKYTCTGSDPLTVQYINADPNYLAIIPIKGKSLVFVNTISASGAKYEAGQFVWWNKGSDATLSDVTEGLDAAPVLTCTELIETP